MSRPVKHSYHRYYEERDGVVNQASSTVTAPLSSSQLSPPKSTKSNHSQKNSSDQMDRRTRLSHFSPIVGFGRSTFFDDEFDRFATRPYWADSSVFGGHRIGDVVNDLVDNEVEFKVTIDVSQFEPDEIKVNIIDDNLVIEAKHEERVDKFGAISRSFTRRFKLPSSVNPDEVKSELSREGSLTVRYEKQRPTGNVKQIPIHVQKP